MKIVVYNPKMKEDTDLCEKIKKYSTTNSKEIRIFFTNNKSKLLTKSDYFDCAFLYSGNNSQRDLKIIEEFKRKHIDCYIILYSESYITAKDTLYLKPHRYLTIPIEYSLLHEALNAVYTDCPVGKYISIKSRGLAHQINIRKIKYLEAKNKDCDIVTTHETISINKILKDVEKHLPGISFFRTHRSFCVNLEYIKDFTHQNVILNDGTKLPLSKYRYTDMICAYETFIEFSKT